MVQHEGQRKDKWASGDLYEPYVGRWSKMVSEQFVSWLARPAQGDWLDVGCGTGAITDTILKLAEPASVIGIDPSEGFLGFARKRVQDERAKFEIGNAQAIPYEGNRFDTAVSGLVINFVPEPVQAVREMARVTKQGGTVAVYVWDYADKMELMRYFWDAAIDLRPEVEALDELKRFPICRPEPLEQLFGDAGLAEVEVRAIDVPTNFRDFDDYWGPFLGGQGPAPGYAMSLGEEDRVAVRDLIRSRLPVEDDGSIRLIARAWGVRGVKG